MPPKFPFILVASADLFPCQALSLPATLISAVPREGEFEFHEDDGAKVSLDQVALRTIGRLALSEDGATTQNALSAYWQETRGEEGPSVLALEASNVADMRMLALDWLASQMADAHVLAARRATSFMRELGVLRRQHDEMQANFQKLEEFISSHGPRAPEVGTILAPIASQLPISLRRGSKLIQRMNGTSVGLSDVGIHLVGPIPATKGHLNVSLYSPDTNETLAVWEIATSSLAAGWMRFTLERALGSDAVTLYLVIEYRGQGVVNLATSIQHPDSRFRPLVDGIEFETLPAMRTWYWISGTKSPHPAGAIAQVGGKNAPHFVERDILANAVNLIKPAEPVPMFREGSTLLVHAETDHTACAVLSGLALPGTVQVSAIVETQHADAQEIEYQMCLHPEDVTPSEMPIFAPALTSGWLKLPPLEVGQLQIILPEALISRHSIYLMTRMADSATNNSFAWSTFSRLCIQF